MAEARICFQCRHYQPPPAQLALGHLAGMTWLVGYATWRSCPKGAQVGLDYVSGEPLWSYDCKILNAAGDCAGFEEGVHPPRKVLISEGCWYKPWTWGSFRWKDAALPRKEK